MDCIIVDDERLSRDLLEKLVEDYCADLEVKSVCKNAMEALKAVTEHTPHVVFLDINMPQHDGFDFLNMSGANDYQVIFTTAHPEHAIRAIRHEAVDYLLKPINIDELIAAVERARQRIFSSDGNRSLSKLIISSIDQMHVIDPAQILFLKAQRAYTEIVMQDGTILASKPLLEIHERLSKDDFYRVHRSYVVNLRQIVSIHQKDQALEVVGGKIIPFSRDRKNAIVKVLQGR